MPTFDEMFEACAQGLVEHEFGQSCRLSRGANLSDWFTAVRTPANDDGGSEPVPEVGKFYFWTFAVADAKTGVTLWRPKLNDVIETTNHAGAKMIFQIQATDGQEAIALIDQEKRYRVRAQYTQ